MLAIRMQRTGRKGHAQFRLIVQDSRRSPTSGRVVAQLGHYDPHSKLTVIDKEKAAFYLEHGAQPSPRVTSILKSEKVKMPDWVEKPAKKSSAIKNLEKLRRNRPPEPKTPVVVDESPVAESEDSSVEEIVEPETVSGVVTEEESTTVPEETVAASEAADEAEKPASDTEKTS